MSIEKFWLEKALLGTTMLPILLLYINRLYEGAILSSFFLFIITDFSSTLISPCQTFSTLMPSSYCLYFLKQPKANDLLSVYSLHCGPSAEFDSVIFLLYSISSACARVACPLARGQQPNYGRVLITMIN